MAELEHSILVVEDEEEWRDILFDILKPCGYSVIYAANVQDAIHLLDRHRFSIVTVDLRFRKSGTIKFKEGRMLLEHIQKNYPEIGCIVISGSVESIQEGTDLVLDFRRVIRKYLDKDDEQLPYLLVKEAESIIAERDVVPSSLPTVGGPQLVSQRHHLENLLKQHHENLRELETRKAKYTSIDVPIRIVNEIKGEQSEIERITQELEKLQG